MKTNNPEDNQWKDWEYKGRCMYCLKFGVNIFGECHCAYREVTRVFTITDVKEILSQQAEKQVECLDCKAHKSVMVCIPCRNRFRDRALDKQAEKIRAEYDDEVSAGEQPPYVEVEFKDLTNNND